MSGIAGLDSMSLTAPSVSFRKHWGACNNRYICFPFYGPLILPGLLVLRSFRHKDQPVYSVFCHSNSLTHSWCIKVNFQPHFSDFRCLGCQLCRPELQDEGLGMERASFYPSTQGFYHYRWHWSIMDSRGQHNLMFCCRT